MVTARKITLIPAVEAFAPMETESSTRLKRVAAYARVSTENEEQLSSYEAQVDHYTRYIKSNNQWNFVEVYADEGISATSTKKRDGFNRMIKDALAGKIDLIITKSVSRFARNTVDTLTTVRKLKDKGVEVYFEKENIYTLDSKGELLITIMSSLAQEESRSISENVTWGQRKRFADGKVTLPYKQFLGYEKGEDGLPKIVESEAKTIRLIYKLFLEGNTPTGIAKYLTEKKILSPAKKKVWSESTIRSILKNEKYKGDAILQKSFTVDFLTKKKKVNEGEVPQYYVENSHPAIITPEVFELTQEEFKRRKSTGKYTSAISCFASRIVCGECGGAFGRKVWHSNTKYESKIWQCNNKFKKKKFCNTPHLKEDIVKEAFTEAFNSLLKNKEEILSNYDLIIEKVVNFTKEKNEQEIIEEKCQGLEKKLQNLIAQNARSLMSKEEYEEKYNKYARKYNELQQRHNDLENEIVKRKAQKNQIEAFIKELNKKEGLLEEFDEELWRATIKEMVIKSDKEVTFEFKDGTKLDWNIG